MSLWYSDSFLLSPLAQGPISVAHRFSHDTALFDVTCPQPVYPRHYSSPHSSTHHHSTPSANFARGRSLGSGPYPGGSGMFAVTHPPKMQEFCSPHGTLRRSLRGLQPQTTIPSASNVGGLGVSTITHPPRIQETPRPPLHGLQHQSTIPDVPSRGGYGLSNHTLQPQYELQPQSVTPGDPHLSDPAASSVTHPSAIRFPSDGTLRPPLYGTHSQNVIPGVPYLGGPGEEVEIRTVSKKKLPTSRRPLPDKKDYQGRIF